MRDRPPVLSVLVEDNHTKNIIGRDETLIPGKSTIIVQHVFIYIVIYYIIYMHYLYYMHYMYYIYILYILYTL